MHRVFGFFRLTAELAPKYPPTRSALKDLEKRLDSPEDLRIRNLIGLGAASESNDVTIVDQIPVNGPGNRLRSFAGGPQDRRAGHKVQYISAELCHRRS